jgi:bla regulator protein BlaR1
MIGGLPNHLWQSTLFAVTAGLLAIAFRKDQAQIRYWLWLSASLKFLVPFSLLMSLGSHLEWGPTAKIAKQPVSFTVVQITEPLPDTLSLAPSKPGRTYSFPIAILGLWVCGFGVIALVRFKAWLRVRAAVRASSHLEIPATVEVRSSPGLLEPGVVGLLRPVLLLPAGITELLTKPQLEAVLTHERCHIQRRDNLTAAIHMIVEALFWFHPLVWWIGARLVEERERACDEDVLRLGSEPQVYAEGILKVCQFYVESPLTCVAGVTGRDLKKRILRIMTGHHGRKLDLRRKLMLIVAGLLAVAAPAVIGVLHATQGRAEAQAPDTSHSYEYEVASIKPHKSGAFAIKLMFVPDGLTVTNGTLRTLIHAAYGVEENQVSGGPRWLNSEHYDIEAKINSATFDSLRKLSQEQSWLERQRMLQALLADRFKLTIHRETTQLPVYALVIAKRGPKLQEAKPGDAYPNGIKGPDGRPDAGLFMSGRGSITGQGTPVALLARLLTRQLGRTVEDRTGLDGKYDFTLKWTPDESQGEVFRGPDQQAPPTLPYRIRMSLRSLPQSRNNWD